MVTRSTVFKTNRSQAVRLPRAVAFPEDVHEVEITVVGNTRIISPAGRGWEEFFDSPPASEDFMTERVDLPPDDREPL